MKLLPAFLCLAWLCACSDRDVVAELVARLDRDFNRRDADAYLANFEPGNRHLFKTLDQRTRLLLGGAVRLHRATTIQEVTTLGDRRVALVKSVTGAADGSSEISLAEYAYLVCKVRDDAAIGTFMVEVDNTLLNDAPENSFKCPACNYEVAGDASWLAVPHRRDRTGCMEAISFYSLESDLSLDVSVFLDAEASPADSALRAYVEIVAADRDVEVPRDLRISSWVPPRHGVDPPEGLDGAKTDLQLPGDQPTRLHLLTLGTLRYLLVLRGHEIDTAQAGEIVDSFRLLDPDASLEILQARPVAAHAGGSFDGDTYDNSIYGVTLTGPEGWTHSMAAFGCLFEVTFRCPEGRGKLWVTAYGPQPGLSSWHSRVAESWMENYFEQKGMEILAPGAWREDASGFQLLDLQTRPPRSSEVLQPRMIRLAMAEDLLLVLHGYGDEDADRALIKDSFDSLERIR